jgi:uracil-DNA glycosylase
MAESFDNLREGLRACTRCPLYQPATQVVGGEGPRDSPLMIVGEQPGDREDAEGRPFVRPSGQLLDRLAEEAGLDRRAAYVTNAVKHFKFRPRGKRRLHEPPNRAEIEICRWWLEMEIRLVRPKLILALGGTAVESLTGARRGILKRRGTVEETRFGPVFVTLHPSYLLRLRDSERKADEKARFRDDLGAVADRLRTL